PSEHPLSFARSTATEPRCRPFAQPITPSRLRIACCPRPLLAVLPGECVCECAKRNAKALCGERWVERGRGSRRHSPARKAHGCRSPAFHLADPLPHRQCV